MDQRLRELERRWRASGAVLDGAAWLAERLRVEPEGTGLRTRLVAAAHAGDPVVCAVLDQRPAPTTAACRRSPATPPSSTRRGTL